jgi:hypothetical protein
VDIGDVDVSLLNFLFEAALLVVFSKFSVNQSFRAALRNLELQ